MFTFPLVVLTVVTAVLLGGAVFFLNIAQKCEDKMYGLIATTSTSRMILGQKSKAERTACFLFAIGFLCSMMIAGTMEYSDLVR